jgi:hypothetical protein
MIVVVPPGRGPRSGLEGVGGKGAAERHLHVGVAVDPTGDHQLASRVDDSADRRRDVTEHLRARREDGRDGVPVDQDVLQRGAGGADHRAVRDQCRLPSHVPLPTVR